jgi:hypothetical protein
MGEIRKLARKAESKHFGDLGKKNWWMIDLKEMG